MNDDQANFKGTVYTEFGTITFTSTKDLDEYFRLIAVDVLNSSRNSAVIDEVINDEG